jgi:outer membrane biosynthesis protein TonB
MKAILNVLVISAILVPICALGQACAKQVKVPEYPPVARAAHWQGIVDLTVEIGDQGKVIKVDGTGSYPILVDHAKENVKEWIFCAAKLSGSKQVKLRFEYWLEGTPVYPQPPAKVMVDLADATVLIRTPPGIPMP